MGNTDSIPVLSQAKSGVQLICGDTEGAARTQENFLRECPGVSQVTSSVQFLAGDTDGALETQKRCGKAMLNMVDGLPAVGHVKGVVHYAFNDKEDGDRAMKSASRTTGVLLGGAGGFIVGGPAGAVAGGIYGGVTADSITTIVDSEIHGEFRPSGYIAGIDNAINNPNVGDIFDLILMPVDDGFAGYGAGKMVNKIQKSTVIKQNPTVVKQNSALANALETKATAIQEAADAGKSGMTSMEYMKQSNKASDMFYKAEQLREKYYYQKQPKFQHQEQQDYQQQQQQQHRQQEHQWHRSRSRTQQQDSDDSDDEPECICRPIKLRVLYLNARSINPENRKPKFIEKIEKIKKLIEQSNPNIIAIVESWLLEEHDDKHILNSLQLYDYTIYRLGRGEVNKYNAYYKDRNEAAANMPYASRGGGGIMVAFRNTLNPMCLRRNRAEDLYDNVMNFEIDCAFNCRKCNAQSMPGNFGFVVVYGRPNRFDDQTRSEFKRLDKEIVTRIYHLADHYVDSDGHNGFVMVGDFNYRNIITDLVRVPTHTGGRTLDHVFRSPPWLVNEVRVTQPISDHSALIFDINLGHDFSRYEPCDYCQK